MDIDPDKIGIYFLTLHVSEYLLACCRYVKFNSLRAGMVEDPAQHPWSSGPARTGIKKRSQLDFGPISPGRGSTSAERAEKYGKWLLTREASQHGHVTTKSTFALAISKKSSA